jgi:hypothetical protein
MKASEWEMMAYKDRALEIISDLAACEKERDEEFDIATGYHKRWCKWQERAERAEALLREAREVIASILDCTRPPDSWTYGRWPDAYKNARALLARMEGI